MKRVLLLFCFCLFWVGSSKALEPGPHVRVILDTSLSMSKHLKKLNIGPNDPGRLAILSTILLYDLAEPIITDQDGSFEVIPFHKHYVWRSPNARPPSKNGQRIVAKPGQRDTFVNKLNKLKNEAKMTHFYPGLKAAIEDLKKTSGGDYDVRTIVLVTDGLPDNDYNTLDKENQLIENLLPELDRYNIRLYVLAFSRIAFQNQDFFDAMTRNDTLGEVFVDPSGDELLSNMLEIFALSFGYAVDKPVHALPNVPPLDLNKGMQPERVAVVVLNQTRPQIPPKLDLTSPKRKLNDEGLQSAEEKGASYSLRWILSPDQGTYDFNSDVTQGQVAMLHPSRVELEIFPVPPLTQTQRTMAKTRFPLRVLVKSPHGGDPGDLEIKFRQLGPRSGNDYAWRGKKRAPSTGSKLTKEGRAYDISLKYRENRKSLQQPYRGFLEIEARRGNAVVGSMRLDHAHPIDIYPFLSITPFPSIADASNKALESQEEACAPFSLKIQGHLPRQPTYTVRATLNPSDTKVINREFYKSTFTLDAPLPLYFESRPGVQPGDWYNGYSMGKNELTGQHEICIKVGKPKAGDPAKPIVLPVKFSLSHSPYDDFGVMEDFELKVRLVKPPFSWTYIILVGAALLALLALWYMRNRPTLPADLGYAISSTGPTEPKTFSRLQEGSLMARLLGLVVNRPVIAGDQVLAWVRPVDAELYGLRLAKDYRIETLAQTEEIERYRGLAMIVVDRIYRLHGNNKTYWFQMKYGFK